MIHHLFLIKTLEAGSRYALFLSLRAESGTGSLLACSTGACSCDETDAFCLRQPLTRYLMWLFSLVTFMAHALHPDHLPTRQYAA